MSKCKIKEFVTQLRGVSYKPTDVTDASNGTPILRANNIQDDGMVYDDLVYIKSEKVKQAQKLQAGDIVICTSSGSKALVGKASIFTGYSKIISFGAFCKALRINDVVGINKDFIRLFFSSKLYREQIASSSIGANINNIKSENIDDLNINIPTPELQSVAVKTLTQLNKAILSKKEQLKQLDELVKSRFIEMFDTIDMSEERKDWVELEKISKIYSGTTPSTKDAENWKVDIHWNTPAEMNKDTFYITDTVRKITEKGRKSKSLEMMPTNTVLLSTRAPIGKVGITGVPMTCNQGFKNFGCGDKLNPIYLYILLKENTEYLNSLGSGTTFLEVSKSKIAKTKIPVPPIELQNTFAEIVKQVDKSKFIVQKQIEDLQELLDSKMDEYFG